MSAPELIAVIGPNGSGKSSAIYETAVSESVLFVNPDDVARRDYADVQDEAERNFLAWKSCNAQREALLTEGVSFGFETVGSHRSKVEFLRTAKHLGYQVSVLFVATEDPDINIARIAQRQAKGGHGVPDEKVRSRYERVLALLPEYFALADYAWVWDNSEDAETKGTSTIRALVHKSLGNIEVFPAAQDVGWVNRYLLDDLRLLGDV